MTAHDDIPAPATIRVLVIEDAPELRLLVTASLEREGFAVAAVEDGETGVATARADTPDVIVLDVGLPGINGIEVCRQIRTFSDAYIVMLTARDDEVDKLLGLGIGADDYMTKPFSPRELVARINVMLRRPRVGQGTATGATEPGLVIDRDAREVTLRGESVPLTKLEFDILSALSRRPRRVLSRRQLLDQVWGPDWFGDRHVVEVHVSNLRRKLETRAEHRYIHTVRGVGYRFEPD